MTAPFLVARAPISRDGKSRLRKTIGIISVLGVLGSITILMPLIMYTGATVGGDSTSSGSQLAGACAPLAVSGGVTISLSADQQTNAGTIVQTGRRLGVPDRGLVIAVATALQESTLRNLPYGDRDSVGLFQQRPSSGWGTVAQLTDPPTSASKFFKALLAVPGWQTMPLTLAAQTVQRSAFPLAYAQWEQLATSLVTKAVGHSNLGCSDVSGVGLPQGTTGLMLRVALQQQGKPYFWGGTGPAYFDCSGLVVYSWEMAGYQLSVRTSEQMFNVSTPVIVGQEQPGDLIFGDFNAQGRNPGHVMIVVRPGLAVEAPHAGDVVKTVTYTVDGTAWRLGRLPASALKRIPTLN